MNQIISKYMRNFRFLLLTFVTGIFYFCFYLVGITFGIGMAFTLVGLPILHYVLRSTRTFVQYERTQTKVYTDISIAMVSSRRGEGSLWEQVRAELSDVRNWRTIFWLMLKFVIGIASILCAVLFYVAPLMFMLTPFLYSFIDVTIMGMTIQTLKEALLIMLVGVILMGVGHYLGNGLVKMIGGYTRCMAKGLTDKV
ncbi:sensor domain-containing protein [Paenibacillus alba]|uniref:sensor domain-containing protein n=1 Tax=Paenibacillus alba TaxID=1197127 RepID=UPI001C20B4E4|nr:sensor domain-containing protein [Paenibacillus alba]